jgi:hypothetical protein
VPELRFPPEDEEFAAAYNYNSLASVVSTTQNKLSVFFLKKGDYSKRTAPSFRGGKKSHPPSADTSLSRL